ALLEDAHHFVPQRLAGRADLLQELQARVTRVLRLLDRDLDVPRVLDLVAQGADAAVDAGRAHRGRPHIDAAAPRPEVQGHADEGDLAVGHFRPKLARA